MSCSGQSALRMAVVSSHQVKWLIWSAGFQVCHLQDCFWNLSAVWAKVRLISCESERLALTELNWVASLVQFSIWNTQTLLNLKWLKEEIIFSHQLLCFRSSTGTSYPRDVVEMIFSLKYILGYLGKHSCCLQQGLEPRKMNCKQKAFCPSPFCFTVWLLQHRVLLSALHVSFHTSL